MGKGNIHVFANTTQWFNHILLEWVVKLLTVSPLAFDRKLAFAITIAIARDRAIALALGLRRAIGRIVSPSGFKIDTTDMCIDLIFSHVGIRGQRFAGMWS